MFMQNYIQQGFAFQLYTALHNEGVEAARQITFWTTLNTLYLMDSGITAILITTITPFIKERRFFVKGIVVLLGLCAALLTGVNGLFHPAATAQRFQTIIEELQQATSQYNEEYHRLQPGPSYVQDELSLRDKYAAFQTQIAGEMNSIRLSFGSLETHQTTSVPLTIPPVTVPLTSH